MLKNMKCGGQAPALRNLKFKIDSPEQSERLQRVLFSLGYKWHSCSGKPEETYRDCIYAESECSLGYSRAAFFHDPFVSEYEEQNTDSFIESHEEKASHDADNMAECAARAGAEKPDKFLEDAFDKPLITESPWVLNDGTMPDLPEGMLVDVMFESGDVDTEGGVANLWMWDFEGDYCDYDIAQWRFHRPEDAEFYKQPKTDISRIKLRWSSCPDHIQEELDTANGYNILSKEAPVRNKYMREIKQGVWIDVYDIIRAWGVTSGPLQHLLKKALCPGKRIHKDEHEDLRDILASAKRALEIYEEWHV